MDILLTKEDVAERYHVSQATLNRWLAERKIPYIKVGARVLFKEMDLRQVDRDNKMRSLKK